MTDAPSLDGGLDGLGGLPAVVADIVCWLVFFLQRTQAAEADHLDEAVAGGAGRGDRSKAPVPVEVRPADVPRAPQHREGDVLGSPLGAFLLEMADGVGLE